MHHFKCSQGSRSILTIALLATFAAAHHVNAQAEKDPHRPACTGATCRKVESFVKAHYCGESPAGNGPDDSCDLRSRKKPGPGVNVKVDVDCEWNTNKGEAECEQHGQPSQDVRNVLIGQLRELGLPPKASGKIYYTVWESTQAAWSVAEADYSRQVGSDVELCQVIVLIDKNSHVIRLRKVPFQKTDSDVPAVTQWSLLDLADAQGNGQVDIILQGDEYENHWLEVVSVRDGTPRTVFSGLGYYL